MRTSKDLAGLAIIDVRDGKKLGQVSETVVSPDDGRLLGFVMKSGGILSRDESVVEIDDVRSVGADAITVEGEDLVHQADAASDAFREARGGNRALIGHKVVSQGGTVVGQVADIVISEDERRVTGLVLGGGMFEKGDALSADRIVSVGPDVVIVADEHAAAEAGPFARSPKAPDRSDAFPGEPGHSPLTEGGHRHEDGGTTEEPA
jgi:uncharacterized protein YrrD